MTTDQHTNFSASDIKHMRGALALARRGLGDVWPNPAVGCVLVKDDEIIGEGWTGKGGRPHAETVALESAGKAAKGATAYVSLEPCAHQGRTPPCAEALIEAGIARAVIACRDPDPRVAGKGTAMLRVAGVEVEEGVLEDEARKMNAGFFSRIERKRPYVTLKIATSPDQKIAAEPGVRTEITGPEAQDYSHMMRAEHDAILVGVGTVLADDPELTCRLEGLEDRSPVRIILDSAGMARTPDDANVVRTAGEVPTWLFTGSVEGRRLDAPGLQIVRSKNLSNLDAFLNMLANLGITRLLVEGGSAVQASFLRGGVVDELYWFQGPVELGEGGVPAAEGLDLAAFEKSGVFELAGTEKLGKDVLAKLVATS